MVLYFSSGSTGPYCELANQQTRLHAAQTGCDLAWRRQSHTEPGPQALYQQLVSPGAGGPGRSSRDAEKFAPSYPEEASEPKYCLGNQTASPVLTPYQDHARHIDPVEAKGPGDRWAYS